MSIQQERLLEFQGIPRVLLAASLAGNKLVAKELPKSCSTIAAGTLFQATALINRTQFDLILIGIFFDDSKMFELLRAVRQSGVNRNTPVICFRPEHTPYGDLTADSVEKALAILGATKFFDLSNPSEADWQRFKNYVRSFLRHC